MLFSISLYFAILNVQFNLFSSCFYSLSLVFLPPFSTIVLIFIKAYYVFWFSLSFFYILYIFHCTSFIFLLLIFFLPFPFSNFPILTLIHSISRKSNPTFFFMLYLLLFIFSFFFFTWGPNLSSHHGSLSSTSEQQLPRQNSQGRQFSH